MKKWLLAICLTFFGLHAEEWVSEELYKDWKQVFKIENVLYQESTEFQNLILFQNVMWGRVLALDGVIQLTEKDEFVYHEMMTHVPLITHGQVKSVLVIGGGDGGILREVLKHDSVEKIVLVEIDPDVIRFSKLYLPFVSQGSLDDPRVEVIIEDGMDYVKRAKDHFDVILCDSTDPQGPGAVLFTEEFYGCCKRLLNQGGIFVNQAGVPSGQGEELKMICHNLKENFKNVTLYLGVIPTYIGGHMAFGFATDEMALQDINVGEIESRIQKIKGKTLYYNARIHKACFALPNYILETLLFSEAKSSEI